MTLMPSFHPYARLLAVPVLFLLVATAQPLPAKTQAPRFSLTISLPQDVIRADSEMPLEITMTNTSDKEFTYGVAFAPPLWTHLCRLDVRDSTGALVPQKSSMHQFDAGTEGGPALILQRGEKVTVEVLLNRVYDLSKPGQYTIQAVRDNGAGVAVKSNVLTVSFAGEKPAPEKAQPPFSVTLTSPYAAIKAGYQVPVIVAVKNVSAKKLTLRSWVEDTRVAAGTGHEFSTGIEVRDSMGNPVRRTKEGQALDTEATFPAGRFNFISLSPGEDYQETRIVGHLYDLSQPGAYKLQVALTDPQTNLVVRSNAVAVDVLSADDHSMANVQPPFLLDIRAVEDATGYNFKAGVYLAITNRSDHPIAFDIGFGDNDVDIYDHTGNLAPLTEAGRRNRGPLPRGGPPTQHLQPGETKSGGAIGLDSLYVLAPGTYTVQMRAFDGESKTIVASNRVTVTVGR